MNTHHATAVAIINQMADALRMPSPALARRHARLAVIDYAFAYRNRHLTPEQTARMIEDAYLHLESAVNNGADRERIELHFYRIRTRYTHARHVQAIVDSICLGCGQQNANCYCGGDCGATR